MALRSAVSTVRARALYVSVTVAMLVTACSSAPLLVPVATAPAATTAPIPAPLVCLLPGQGAALPALPTSAPFTGHLLIAESSGKSRILEINPSGTVTWTLSTASPPLAHPLGAPDDAFYTTGCTAIVANSEYGQGALAVNRLTSAVLWQIGGYLRRGDNLTHFG